MNPFYTHFAYSGPDLGDSELLMAPATVNCYLDIMRYGFVWLNLIFAIFRPRTVVREGFSVLYNTIVHT